MTAAQDFASFHVMRFPAPVSGHDRGFDRPDGPRLWRFLPSQVLGEETGRPSHVSDRWCAMALHESRAEADAAFDAPETLMPWLDEAVESWHMVAVPFAHHGVAKWSDGPPTDGTAFRVAKVTRGGPVAVVTSAGYTDPGPEDMPRMIAFSAGVEVARAAHGAAPGNLASDVFNGAAIDGMDGITLTLWTDERAMIASAYKPGTHRSEMDRHEAETLFDRSSFSRLKPLKSRGQWNGHDPLEGRLD